MRTARFIAPKGGVYHVTAHTIDTSEPYPLTDAEKERLYRLIKAMSGFTGIRVLTHALMGNHFHLFLEVPERPAAIPEAEVVRRLNHLPRRSRSKLRPGDELARKIQRCRDLEMPESVVESMLGPVRARMFDLSRFMQELLSRFTQNYNLRHGRKGTLWDDRFHSTLVEPGTEVLLAVAAYIELNPYRAGLCDDSLDYRFTSFSAARGGCRFAINGLKRLLALCTPRAPVGEESDLLRMYYATIITPSPGGKPVPEHSAAIPLDPLRFRRRYLTRGKILGSRIFVEDLMSAWKRKQHLKRPPRPHAPDGSADALWVVHPLRSPL